MPFQLLDQFYEYTILGVAIASFIYLGFLAAGEEIEQPFGKRPSATGSPHTLTPAVRIRRERPRSGPVLRARRARGYGAAEADGVYECSGGRGRGGRESEPGGEAEGGGEGVWGGCAGGGMGGVSGEGLKKAKGEAGQC